MAKECRGVISAIERVMGRRLDSSLIDELEDARKHLESVFKLLWGLEQGLPENAISTNLRSLFLEARDGFSEISSHSGTVLNLLKPFMRSKSPTRGISEVLEIIKFENIADQVRASKPSRSSGQITTDMVCLVTALLDCTCDKSYIASIPVELLDNALRRKLRCVPIFFKLSARWCIQHECAKHFFTHVESVAYTAAYLYIKGFAHKEDSEFRELLERLSSLDCELRQIYLCVSTSLKSEAMNNQDMRNFISYLQEELKELKDHDAISTVAFISLDDGLGLIHGLMTIVEIYCLEFRQLVSLRSHMEALAIEAAIVIYSYGKETDMPVHLKLVFSHVRLEFNLVRILKRTNAHLKDLILYVLEELIFLGHFLKDALKHLKEQTKLTNFLMLIQSVTCQACADIDSLSRKKYLAGKTDCLHFQLLLKFTFIKTVIRQMRLRDHSTINLLDFFQHPISLKVVDSYFSMLTSSSESGRLDVDEVLMGFLEYILDKSLFKCKSNMTIIVADEVEMFYHGLLLLATYLFNEDINKSRKFNLIFQFLTEAFKLAKYERRLMDLLNHKGTLEAEILDLIKTAHEELILLVAFLMDVLRQHVELNKFNDLLVRFEVTAQRLARISDLLDVGSTEKLRLSLCAYLQGIEPAKVDVRKVFFLLQDASPCNMTDGEDLIKFLLSHQDWPLNDDACSFSILKNQITVIKDLVCLGSFLADFVQYHDMHQELKDLMKCVRDRKYVCLFPIEDNRPAWYDTLYLYDVKKLLKFVEDEVKSICLKFLDPSVYRFPKTDGLGFLNCFLGKLEELLQSKLHSITDLKHHIESFKEGSLGLRSLVDHLAESYDEDDETYGHIIRVTEMAHKAEYVIDSGLTYSHHPWYKDLWISEVIGIMKCVNKAVTDAFGREKTDMTLHKVAKISMNIVASSSASTPRENEEMEGFEEAMDKIKEQLLRGSSHLDIISIVGMPGIGKTTLAEKIYNDLTATRRFDVHAKCRVTQSYSWKELLLTILNDVCGPADRTQNKEDELADELRRFFLTKRFLVLVDDVWDKKVWDYLYMCVRDSRNKSRIILTTRLRDIANYAKCESNPHHLRLFRDDESWRLLQELVFQGDSCPPDLVDVGIRIAKGCGGLPLFIALVSGVLKKKKNADTWKEVEESVGSQNIGSLEESMSLIEFSYKNLPHHLRPCFLYFGGFLKGKDIHVSKLARLWQVEGLLQADKQKGTEDAAQDFLEDLISRNLVMAMEKRPNDKVKRCRIHDLLHNFCLEKSKQENFLNQITREEHTLPEKPKDYRLFIHSSQDVIERWRPCHSNIRSLHLKVTDRDNLSLPHDISFIFDIFKLVKVLDLESYNMGRTFPSEVQSLTHLRYFAVQTGANSIPSFIAKLQNLETFVVKGLRGVVILPCALLKMVKLRHILVKDDASINLDENMEGLRNYQLDNLEAFSTPCLSYGKDAEIILKKMPNLRKLSCIFLGTSGSFKKGKGRSVLFPRLEFLSHLESLKLVSDSFPEKLPHEFNFPSKLKELTLSKFRLPWSEISIVGKLPNLEILRLVFRAFEGDQWEVNDSEFPELKYLKLDNINISQWSVSDNAFPKLERLVLTKCNRLQEVPSHFGDATSLKSIEVNWCGGFVAASALEIEKMQREDYGNDAFAVAIQPPVWTVESTP